MVIELLSSLKANAPGELVPKLLELPMNQYPIRRSLIAWRSRTRTSSRNVRAIRPLTHSL
jgi:hypothetical protein